MTSLLNLTRVSLRSLEMTEKQSDGGSISGISSCRIRLKTILSSYSQRENDKEISTESHLPFRRARPTIGSWYSVLTFSTLHVTNKSTISVRFQWTIRAIYHQDCRICFIQAFEVNEGQQLPNPTTYLHSGIRKRLKLPSFFTVHAL